jgi:AcrR family transcriptional regulator
MPANAGRPPRADARRNRARILEVAFESFAAEGLTVPVQEIARRAGVGTGTVSRHFPTKEALFEAIVLSRVEHLIAEAGRLMAAGDPGSAFFEYFSLLVAEGAANRGLADALSGAGFDLEGAAARRGLDVAGTLRVLLTQAQQAGAVRSDIDAADVKALITGCLAREHDAADAAARDRMTSVVCQGLRPSPP